MKKLFLLAVTALLAFGCSGDDNPNKVYNGDIVLSSQDEVNAFAAKRYIEVTGNLTIGTEHDMPQTNITDVSGLSTLKKVHNLSVTYNGNLTSLLGLENIEVQRLFTLAENPVMQNPDVMPHFAEKSSIRISYNPAINFLPVVDAVNYGMIDVTGNENLENLTMLSEIESVSSLVISANGKLKNLKGLESQSKIDVIWITSNMGLETVEGLNNLENVCQLIFTANESLTTLSHLSSLKVIGGNKQYFPVLELRYNHKLTSLGGLENLKEVNDKHCFITITDNWTLTDFCALRGLLQNPPVEGFSISLFGNKYVPSISAIKNGNCSQ